MELHQALIAQAVLWLVVAVGFLLSGQASLFHPVTIYLLFHGLVFVMRPILVVCCGFDSVWNYMFFDPSPEILVRSMAVSSVALAVFCSACLAFGWCQAGNYPSQPRAFTQAQLGSSRPPTEAGYSGPVSREKPGKLVRRNYRKPEPVGGSVAGTAALS